MYIKIVHTADLHIGSFFTATPEIAKKRASEQLDALRFVVALCEENEADALLIAGDLFDSIRVPKKLLTQVTEILGSCKAPVFITPGDCDPATPDSCYMSDCWPENVHIFKGALDHFDIAEKQATIWGVGMTHLSEPESLLTKFKPNSRNANILMMHADLISGSDEIGRCNPVTKEKLASLGIDYCALGHGSKNFTREIGEFRYSVSGAPFARSFDDTGDKGVYTGHVGRGFSHMTFTPIPGRKYITDRINVSGCADSDRLCEKIISAISKGGEGYAENIYRLTLTGALPAEFVPDIPSIEKKLMQKIHFVRLSDRTTILADTASLMNDSSLRGAFVRNIVNRGKNDDRGQERYLRALMYGLRAFDGEVTSSEDN